MKKRANQRDILKARELRKNMTKEERHLWYDFLSGYPAHFRRQKAIGRYIADFYCESAKLVIELDGLQHYEPDAVDYDRMRTEYMEAMGVIVMRFSNREVRDCFRKVCMEIHEAVQAHTR